MRKLVHFQKLKHGTMNSAAYSVIESVDQSENTKWASAINETHSFRVFSLKQPNRLAWWKLDLRITEIRNEYVIN